MFQTFALVRSNADVVVCMLAAAIAVLMVTLQVTVFSFLVDVVSKFSWREDVSNPFSGVFRKMLRLFSSVVGLSVSAASAALSLLLRFWAIAILAIVFSVLALSVNESLAEMVDGSDKAFSLGVRTLQYTLYPIGLLVEIILVLSLAQRSALGAQRSAFFLNAPHFFIE